MTLPVDTVLIRAAQILKDGGWIRSLGNGRGGPTCAVGAISMALGGEAGVGAYSRVNFSEAGKFFAEYLVDRDEVKGNGNANDIIIFIWNDNQSGEGHVIQTLINAAGEWIDRQGEANLSIMNDLL